MNQIHILRTTFGIISVFESLESYTKKIHVHGSVSRARHKTFLLSVLSNVFFGAYVSNRNIILFSGGSNIPERKPYR